MKAPLALSIVSLALLCLASAALFAADAGPRVTVKDGKVYRDGHIYRGIGVNYCDLFQELIPNGKETRTLNGLRFLGEKKIPFVRFWACGFWPSDWDLYFKDKDEWFRRMDLVVQTAEQAGVGLIPDLFWNTSDYPQFAGEFQDQWGNRDSKTHEFMRTYIKEMVTRYKDSPAIWGWEFSNEVNLACDLPNGMEFLGKDIPALKYKLDKDPRNLWTHQMAQVAFEAFAQEVRKYDKVRFVTSGNSAPRGCAYHIGTKMEPIWGDDNNDEAFEAFTWYAPASLDLISVHFYGDAPEKLKYAGGQGIEFSLAALKQFATKLGKPLFVGEFAGAASDDLKPKFAEYQKAILDSLLAQKVDLSAYWVFDYTADRKGTGLVRRDNEYAWVLDQIVEYNSKIAQQLAAEGR